MSAIGTETGSPAGLLYFSAKWGSSPCSQGPTEGRPASLSPSWPRGSALLGEQQASTAGFEVVKEELCPGGQRFLPSSGLTCRLPGTSQGTSDAPLQSALTVPSLPASRCCWESYEVTSQGSEVGPHRGGIVGEAWLVSTET